jgi:GT2 family glycosyltransferase
MVVCREKGAGPNRNAGVAASTGEILAFIDSDCLPEPEWLENGVAGLSRFDIVGGRVTVLVDDPARKSAAEAFEAVFAFDFETCINKKGFTGAGNMIRRRDLFDRVGGFSNGVSEDVEWSRRAVAARGRLGYVADAIVGHPAHRTWREFEAKWRRLNVETFLLHRSSVKGATSWLARCVLLPASAVIYTPKVLAARRPSSLRERFLALGVLYRIRLWRLAHGVPV